MEQVLPGKGLNHTRISKRHTYLPAPSTRCKPGTRVIPLLNIFYICLFTCYFDALKMPALK